MQKDNTLETPAEKRQNIPVEEQIKEKKRYVTNIKVHIFDLIEDKSRILNEIELKKQAVALKEKEILKQQQVLDGERKVLADLEKGIVTVEKQDGADA